MSRPGSDDEFVIERAERKQALLRLAISAVSGAGKTFGGLRVARGIVEAMIDQGLLHGTVEGKVGVVDTERNSASLYAHLYPFDRIALGPPYTVDRYLKAARALANAGKAVVIIDQISHQWAGQGGMLEFVDVARRSGRNSNEFAAWAEATPEQNAFLEGLLALPCHLICTMRAKTAYVLEERERRNGTKYQAPVRVGVKPIQREGVEYEFTTVMDIELATKTATVSKDRTSLFVDPATLESKRFRLTEQVGRDLANWLLVGTPSDAPQLAATPIEKAQALTESHCRACEQAMNMPDLERVYADAQTALKACREQIPAEEFQALRERIVAAKDARKAVLRPQPAAPSAAVITPDQAVALEEMERTAELALGATAQHFGLGRLSLLPKEELQVAANWIAARGTAAGLAVPLPDVLMQAGVVLKPAQLSGAGRFNDLQDDRPWQD